MVAIAFKFGFWKEGSEQRSFYSSLKRKRKRKSWREREREWSWGGTDGKS